MKWFKGKKGNIGEGIDMIEPIKKEEEIDKENSHSKTTGEMLMELDINEQIRQGEINKRKLEEKIKERNIEEWTPKLEEKNTNISLNDIVCESIKKTLKNYTDNFNNYVNFINTFLDDDFKFDIENNSFEIYREYTDGNIFGNVYEYHVKWEFPLKNSWNIDGKGNGLYIKYLTCEDIDTNEEVSYTDLELTIKKPDFLDEDNKCIYKDPESVLCFYKDKYNLSEILSDNNIITVILEIKKLKEIYELKNKVNIGKFTII